MLTINNFYYYEFELVQLIKTHPHLEVTTGNLTTSNMREKDLIPLTLKNKLISEYCKKEYESIKSNKLSTSVRDECIRLWEIACEVGDVKLFTEFVKEVKKKLDSLDDVMVGGVKIFVKNQI